ncbi:MAG TPA: hypothetical protein VFJ57_10630 [Solirubrobacterales bacterium]|nr:hypothetical protein [Solirubrobacterales bacterium]
MTATLVEGKELLETVIASVIAGVGVTTIFAVAIWGVARFADLSRSDRPLAAGGAALVAMLSLLAVVAAVVFGIVVMTRK